MVFSNDCNLGVVVRSSMLHGTHCTAT